MIEQQYFARFGKLLLGVGIAGTAFGVIVLVGGGTPSAFGGSVLCLIFGALQVSSPLLILEHDHFAYRAGPIGARRQILYRDIRGVDLQGKKLTVQVDDAAGRPCILHMNGFATAERDAIQAELQRRATK